jgi:hypothetical protein
LKPAGAIVVKARGVLIQVCHVLVVMEEGLQKSKRQQSANMKLFGVQRRRETNSWS